jgi:hypothetical protein
MKNKYLAVIVLEAEKFKTKEPTDFESSEGHFLVQNGIFYRCLHMVEEARQFSGSLFFCKSINPIYDQYPS